MISISKLLSGRNWHTIKVVMVNWTIFTFIVAGYTLWRLHKTLEVQEVQIKECQEFNKLVREQMSSGRIILELKKDEKTK